MDPPQTFFGYDQGKGKGNGTTVWFIATLELSTVDGMEFPPLEIRMAPGQIDDLLVAASDLDRWGFNSEENDDYFSFKALGLCAERETKIDRSQLMSRSTATKDEGGAVETELPHGVFHLRESLEEQYALGPNEFVVSCWMLQMFPLGLCGWIQPKVWEPPP